MRILFDQGTPIPLRNALPHHIVETAYERGWQLLTNGELLDAAEAAGFEVLVTTDQGLRYQQNLAKHRIRILVLKTANWPKIERHTDKVARVIDSLGARLYEEISFPS
jgi:predicted nuclease of predicted toxin-antitoxin system